VVTVQLAPPRLYVFDTTTSPGVVKTMIVVASFGAVPPGAHWNVPPGMFGVAVNVFDAPTHVSQPDPGDMVWKTIVAVAVLAELPQVAIMVAVFVSPGSAVKVVLLPFVGFTLPAVPGLTAQTGWPPGKLPPTAVAEKLAEPSMQRNTFVGLTLSRCMTLTLAELEEVPHAAQTFAAPVYVPDAVNVADVPEALMEPAVAGITVHVGS
jgi:hypothetical protein